MEIPELAAHGLCKQGDLHLEGEGEGWGGGKFFIRSNLAGNTHAGPDPDTLVINSPFIEACRCFLSATLLLSKYFPRVGQSVCVCAQRDISIDEAASPAASFPLHPLHPRYAVCFTHFLAPFSGRPRPTWVSRGASAPSALSPPSGRGPAASNFSYHAVSAPSRQPPLLRRARPLAFLPAG